MEQKIYMNYTKLKPKCQYATINSKPQEIKTMETISLVNFIQNMVFYLCNVISKLLITDTKSIWHPR
jgi:hypothetical protein